MLPPTPYDAYRHAIASGHYEADPAQDAAMRALDALYHQIAGGFFSRFRRKLGNKPQGVYLYGAVGAGKTWMMGLFYECLRVKKMRCHFHEFMRDVHLELKRLEGHKNPLALIAKNIRKRAEIICFDELFVNDIADAMLLGELFAFLFKEGCFFVMTSNVPPELLYRNGLQRTRFYPAIRLLNEKMQLVKVQSLKDYRWRSLLSMGVYFYPLNEFTHQSVTHLFQSLLGEEPKESTPVVIAGREISVVARAEDLLWCRFDVLCHVPRSVQDYVALSKLFKVFILDEVPVISAEDDNSIWYLISLIDVLYDAKCRLVLRSAAPPDALYQGEKLRFEFQRTLSRLQEMQSKDYWSI